MPSFDATTTADEVLADIDLTGKHALVTGASAGLGEETTRALAGRGASVTMAVRDLPKAEAARDRILASVPGADLELRELDLASLASVHAFVDGYLDSGRPIDLCIANAGIMACPPMTTADGFEMQLGTNHLGHFTLLRGLLPLLQATPGVRVVVLSSSGHRISDVDLDDPGFEHTDYDPWIAYGRSKTANVLCAVALDARLAPTGGQAFAVHPGMIRTELGRHLTPESTEALMKLRPPGEMPTLKSVEQGAATTCFAATSPTLDGARVCFLEDCHVADISTDPLSPTGVRAYALDPERAEALWTRSEALVDGVGGAMSSGAIS